MKRLEFCLCLVLLAVWAPGLRAEGAPETPVSTPSAPNPAGPSSEKLITISLSPFLALPVSGNTAKEYNLGGGAEIFLAYAADKNLLVGLDLGVLSCTVNADNFAATYQQLTGTPLPNGVSVTGDINYLPLMAMAKYSFNSNKIRPYVLWGIGLAFNSASVSAASGSLTVSVIGHETDFLMSEGLGIAFTAGDDLEIFVQARLDMDFTSNSGNDSFTLSSTGNPDQTVKSNLSDDSPTLFLPLQVGVRFL